MSTVSVRRTLLTVVTLLLVWHEAFHVFADGLAMGYAAPWATIWRPGLLGVLFHAALFLGLLWALEVAWRA